MERRDKAVIHQCFMYLIALSILWVYVLQWMPKTEWFIHWMIDFTWSVHTFVWLISQLVYSQQYIPCIHTQTRTHYMLFCMTYQLIEPESNDWWHDPNGINDRKGKKVKKREEKCTWRISLHFRTDPNLLLKIHSRMNNTHNIWFGHN